MKELGLSKSQLTNVAPLAENIARERLDLGQNFISEIGPFESLGEIELVNLEDNPVCCDGIGKLVVALGQDAVVTNACAASDTTHQDN